MTLVFAAIGFISVFILALNARQIGLALGLMDDPKSEKHKLHRESTPLVGAILISTALCVMAISLLLSGDGYNLLIVSAAAIGIGVLGMVDDKLKLSWHSRFVTLWLIMAALLVCVPELRLAELRWSWGVTTELGTLGGSLFTALCLVGLVIALNMMDGFNGSVLSQCLVWSLIFGTFAATGYATVYAYIAAIVALIFGFNLKGKLFLGDGGAYALGILMGCGAILTYSANPTTVYADTIVVWLALPVFDCLRVIFRRKLAGESPFLPQRDHLHHHFICVQGPGLALAFTTGFSLIFGLLSLWIPQYSYLLVGIQLSTIALAVLATSRASIDNRAPAE